MRLSVWTYPWDIADEGAFSALNWLREAGFDAIDLAPNYHAISTFSPRNRKRTVFYSEQGAVYFPARLERYGRIRPKLFDEERVLGAFAEVSESAAGLGIQLNAWVIGMFQPWIARQHPDVAIENAFGHRSYAQTCPSSPDVREYLCALAADLTDQFPIHSMFVENPGHPPFAYGWVRERILVELDAWTRFLLGLCFCASCRGAASQEGVDIVAFRASVADEIAARMERPPASPPDPLENLVAGRCESDAGFAGFAGFVAMRRRTAAAALAEVADAVAKVSSCRVGTQLEPGGWTPSGLVCEDVLPHAGLVALPNPAERLADARAVQSAARKSARSPDLLVSQSGADAERPESEAFRERIARIRQFGPDRVAIYNYGLLRPETLRTIGAAFRQV